MSEDPTPYGADQDQMEIEDSVIDDIKRRRALGRHKYGKSMERTDLKPSEWAKHLEEELLDSVIYAKRLVRELKKLEASGAIPLKTPAEIYMEYSPEC